MSDRFYSPVGGPSRQLFYDDESAAAELNKSNYCTLLR